MEIFTKAAQANHMHMIWWDGSSADAKKEWGGWSTFWRNNLSVLHMSVLVLD